jgi:hypothetical protein
MNSARLAPLLLCAGLLLAAAPGSRGSDGPAITWKKTRIDSQFRSEGVAVADVNRDGRPDILAGNLWYESPSWIPHNTAPAQKFDGATGYSNAFLVFADDVDRDGWPDEIIVGFPGDKAVWRRNPGRNAIGAWQEFPITDSACNETPAFADLDHDGHPELITPYKENQMAFYSPGPTPEKGWVQTLVGEPQKIGTQRFSHGLGVGDINGDKRPDIICKDGYWQAPKHIRKDPWTWVPCKLGPDCATMFTYDFNHDGRRDVFSSAAHQIGVWWWEQVKGSNPPEFKQHVIEQSFSQSHSDVMVDINGDKQPDFVTGKRFWAHGPNGDVNPGDPAMLYWFEFKRHKGEVTWVRHEIDNDSGVGTQFTWAQMNDDDYPDIVTSNKKGVFLFEQVRSR